MLSLQGKSTVISYVHFKSTGQKTKAAAKKVALNAWKEKEMVRIYKKELVHLERILLKVPT